MLCVRARALACSDVCACLCLRVCTECLFACLLAVRVSLCAHTCLCVYLSCACACLWMWHRPPHLLPPPPPLSCGSVYKGRVKNAQEAHEAIRPTQPNLRPEQLREEGSLDDAQLALYSLIWCRAMASQMANARMEQVSGGQVRS